MNRRFFVLTFTVFSLTFFAACGNLGDEAVSVIPATEAAHEQGGDSGQALGASVQAEGLCVLSGHVESQGIMPASFSAAAQNALISKSLFPEVPDSSGLTYTVSAKATIGGVERTATGTVENGSYSIGLPYETGVTGGTEWSVTVSAKSGGNTVLSKTLPVRIDSGSPAAQNFSLGYVSDSTEGNGSISIDISYEITIGVNSIQVTCGPVSETGTTTAATISTPGTAAWSKTNLTPGAYSVKIIFYDNAGNALYAINEVANVYSNLESSVFYGHSDYISSGAVNVSQSLVNALADISAGGIWLGGSGLLDSAAANDSNSGTRFRPVATLQRAFSIANSLAAVDATKTYTINVQGDVDAGTSTSAEAALSSGAKVLLKGTDESTYYTISGGTTAGTYKITTESSSATFQYLIFDKLGGIEVNGGQLTANNCKVTNGISATSHYGGGFTVASGASLESSEGLVIESCETTSAVTTSGGGGIYCGGNLNLTGSTIKGCKASAGYGGALYVTRNSGESAAAVNLDACNIGISSNATASSDTACSNYAALNGGGIYAGQNASIILKNNTLVGYNYAGQNGGGICMNSGAIVSNEMTGEATASNRLTINGNGAGGTGGGGIYCAGMLTLTNFAMSKNKASGSSGCGGALYTTGNSVIANLSKCYIGQQSNPSSAASSASACSNYAALNGGAIYMTWYSKVIFSENGESTIKYNYAGGSGGGVYVNSGTFTTNSSNASDFSFNGAGNSGGGIYNNSVTNLNNCVVKNCKSYGTGTTSAGGGIYNCKTLTINEGTFTSNVSATTGEAIYYKGAASGTSLTLGGKCMFGASQEIYLENKDSQIALSSLTQDSASEKFILTPNISGFTIGTSVITSGLTNTKLGYFDLPTELKDTYALTYKSETNGLFDLKAPSQIEISGRTVSTRPYTSSTSTTYVTTGAFKNADTSPVTVRSIKMAKYEVNYELWYAVYQWATNRAANPYTFGSCGKEGVDAFAPTDETPPSESVPPTTTTVNSGEGRGGQRPVTFVSWRDAVVWCNAYSEYMDLTPVYYTDAAYTSVLRVSDNTSGVSYTEPGSQDCPYIYAGSSNPGNIDMTNCTANGARLPTEAEWEYAARGGNPTATAWNYTYAGGDTLTSIAWIKDGDTLFHCVGKKDKNALWLYDMTGNNTEWCFDWYDTTYAKRVEKGGCAANESTSPNLYIKNKGGSNPYRYGQRSGFRFVQNN